VLILPLLLLLTVSACGGDEGDGSAAGTTTGATSTAPSAPGCKKVDAPKARGEGDETAPTKPLDAGKTYAIVFATNCGSFTVTLDVKSAPKTSASLVALARSGFYDDTIFHRIVPGFVIQGGDPTQTGSGGPGYTTVDPPPASTTYTLGTVAMAKTPAEPAGSSGSQFFVVTTADAGLPAEYAAVGRVTKGLDTVDRIGRLGNSVEQPTQTVLIEQATVTES
jgi:cyclophilin family peptidyl-prolyl cis-trans isomerase